MHGQLFVDFQDSERVLNSFGGLVTNKDPGTKEVFWVRFASDIFSRFFGTQDIADHIVPLISRDPEAVKFLRRWTRRCTYMQYPIFINIHYVSSKCYRMLQYDAFDGHGCDVCGFVQSNLVSSHFEKVWHLFCQGRAWMEHRKALHTEAGWQGRNLNLSFSSSIWFIWSVVVVEFQVSRIDIKRYEKT